MLKDDAILLTVCLLLIIDFFAVMQNVHTHFTLD